jgi:hypothetical protein
MSNNTAHDFRLMVQYINYEPKTKPSFLIDKLPLFGCTKSKK